jgi:MoaA/NifB/PqqE/SkfB family radical SAM enzyme
LCDHFSQIAAPSFLSLAAFERDISRIAELSKSSLGRLNLLGGEPLLHGNLPGILRIARRYLPDTRLWCFTNGLRLLDRNTDEVWRVCRECDVTIQLTKYPINLDIDAIENKAHSERVRLETFQTHTDFMKYTLNPVGDCSLFPVIECCQMNNCTVLRNGRIYMCPMSAHIDKFNAKHGQIFEMHENDSIDIYTVQSFEEIAEFTSKPVPFCRYCDIKAREIQNWRTGGGAADEYI